MNREDTQHISFYISDYVAKKQNWSYNLSAIMAKGYVFHLRKLNECAVNPIQDIQDQHRLMLFHIVNAINHQQEIAAPMVIPYLMGWGDTYHSHHYIPIYWFTFVNFLFAHFPELRWVDMVLIS